VGAHAPGHKRVVIPLGGGRDHIHIHVDVRADQLVEHLVEPAEIFFNVRLQQAELPLAVHLGRLPLVPLAAAVGPIALFLVLIAGVVPVSNASHGGKVCPKPRIGIQPFLPALAHMVAQQHPARALEHHMPQLQPRARVLFGHQRRGHAVQLRQARRQLRGPGRGKF